MTDTTLWGFPLLLAKPRCADDLPIWQADWWFDEMKGYANLRQVHGEPGGEGMYRLLVIVTPRDPHIPADLLRHCSVRREWMTPAESFAAAVAWFEEHGGLPVEFVPRAGEEMEVLDRRGSTTLTNPA